MRVAFLTNVVSPYRAPLFRELANTPDWDFRVFVDTANEFDRQWQDVGEGLPITENRGLRFRRRVVTERPIRSEQIVEMHVPLSLWRGLFRFRPDVVISLELGPRSVIAASYCRLFGVPFVPWSYRSRAAATASGRLRGIVRRALLNQAAAVVGMGTQAREVLRGHGVPDERIFDAPNAPDVASISQRLATSSSAGAAARLREQHAGYRLAVVAGRMVPLKAIDRILETWTGVDSPTRSKWRLLFVGDGPMAPLVRGREADGIHHLGYIPHEEIPDIYRVADLHIFASLADVWGLVVTEGMLCGTPALCSIHAGCADDVITDQLDGWLFDPMNSSDWTVKLTELLRRTDLADVGARAAESAHRFRTASMAHGFRAAIAFAHRDPAAADLAPGNTA